MNQKAQMRVDSGICNLCSAPCSSCMHLNRGSIVSKSDECSEDTYRATATSAISVIEGEILSSKSRACESLQQATHKGTTSFTVNSNHGSCSENVGGTVVMRSSDISDVTDGTEDEHGRANDANVMVTYSKGNSRRKNMPDTVASVRNLVPEGSGKPISYLSSTMLEAQSTDASACNVLQEGKVLELGVCMDLSSSKEESHKYSDQVDQDLNTAKLVEQPDIEECSLQSASVNGSDDLDTLEQDVKVCDICGDSGREDLLAICSKCSDGAEHTYCMREMLQKLPERDWFCEECKFSNEKGQKFQKCSDAETKSTSIASPDIPDSDKRHTQNMEIASTSKRQALETSVTSPKSGSSHKIAASDNSFKNLDERRIKSNQYDKDFSETVHSSMGMRPPSAKSTLLKSNSFSTINSKPKVKTVDEIAYRRKAAKEHPVSNTKEETARTISKSASFKSAIPGRSSIPESKVKMLSSKFSHVQNSKGLKQAKDRIGPEWRKFAKQDRPFSSLTTASSSVSNPKGDSKLKLGNANQESKALKSLDKLSTAAKSMGNLTRKSSETSVTSAGTSSASGNSGSAERKVNQVSLSRDESTPSVSSTAEKASSDLPRSRESSHQVSVSQSRPPFSVGSPRASGDDTSATKRSKEEMIKGSKLKAAIETILSKKPEIQGKKEEPVQMDWLSTPKTNAKYEISSLVDLVSNKTNCKTYDEEGQAKDSSHLENSSKQTSGDNGKQLYAHSSEISIFQNGFAIPAHDFIWQGSLEVQTDRRVLEEFGGIQAHLSTCASPKVLEVVKKLPLKITLDELPRLSTWPTQFQCQGANEDNIALYFFAKDVESYEKSYRGLLASMIKSDLALKGTIDGVELLIFPSNVLPENCQRWNMLFFLWGVFRGRKSNFSASSSCSDPSNKLGVCDPNTVQLLKEIPSLTASLPETVCSVSLEDGKDLFACGESSSEVVREFISSDKNVPVNGDLNVEVCHIEETLLDCQDDCKQEHGKLDSRSSSNVADSCVSLCQKRGSKILLEEQVPQLNLKSNLLASGMKEGASRSEWTQPDPLLVKQGSSRLVSDEEKVTAGYFGGDEVVVDRMNIVGSEVNLERNLENDCSDANLETFLVSSNRKRPLLDLTVPALQTSPSLPSEEKNTIYVGESLTKKQKTGSKSLLVDQAPQINLKPDLLESGMEGESSKCENTQSNTLLVREGSSSLELNHVCKEEKVITGYFGGENVVADRIDIVDSVVKPENIETLSVSSNRKRPLLDLTLPPSPEASTSFPSEEVNTIYLEESLIKRQKTKGEEKMHNLCPSFSRPEETCIEKVIVEDFGERSFFPVASPRIKNFWENSPSSEADHKPRDRIPDLELALGATERKSTNKRPLPFFMGKNNKPFDNIIHIVDEDVAASSLSLSLSFPDRTAKSEQKLDLNSSLLPFDVFSDE